MTLDTAKYQKITTGSPAEQLALQVSSDGRGLTVAPVGGPTLDSQLWQVTPWGGSTYEISPKLSGAAYALAGSATGVDVAPVALSHAPPQVWTLSPASDGTYQLSCGPTGTSRLLTGSAGNGTPSMAADAGQAGQRWTFTGVEPLARTAAVPALAGGSEGPIPSSAIKGTGVARVFLALVDFEAAPGTAEDIGKLRTAIDEPRARREFAAWSYGGLTVNTTTATAWKRMPKPVADYYDPAADKFEYRTFLTDAASLVEGLQNYDVLAVAVPAGATMFVGSAAAHGVDLGPGKPKHQINFCAQTYAENHTTYMHELGHCLGLADLYPFKDPYVHRVGPWDLMGDIVYATGFLNWERHLFGWIGTDRKTCITAGETWKGAIAPPSTRFGTCMVVVRPDAGTGSASTLYVVQVAPAVKSRDGAIDVPEGSGVLVYKVVSAVAGDDKYLEVIARTPVTAAADSSKSLIAAAPFSVGDDITDRADLPFSLKVRSRTGDAYYVELGPKG